MYILSQVCVWTRGHAYVNEVLGQHPYGAYKIRLFFLCVGVPSFVLCTIKSKYAHRTVLFSKLEVCAIFWPRCAKRALCKCVEQTDKQKHRHVHPLFNDAQRRTAFAATFHAKQKLIDNISPSSSPVHSHSTLPESPWECIIYLQLCHNTVVTSCDLHTLWPGATMNSLVNPSLDRKQASFTPIINRKFRIVCVDIEVKWQ